MSVARDLIGLYRDTLALFHEKLRLAQIAMYRQNRKAIIVLEGYDASGRGEVICELSYAWDPRGFEVYPISPQAKTEAAHPFLWSFWNRQSTPGQIAVFDQSWYGRLPVEFAEHGLPDAEHEISIDEINAFERMLMENQISRVKLFLETDRETRRTRLLRRAERPEKRWKLTESDIESYRHRESYEQAFANLLKRCQTPPWHRINANQKKQGRLNALDYILQALNVELKPRTFALNSRVSERLHELSK